MKKLKVLLLLVLCMMVFAGCTKDNEAKVSKDARKQEVTVTPEPTQEPYRMRKTAGMI